MEGYMNTSSRASNCRFSGVNADTDDLLAVAGEHFGQNCFNYFKIIVDQHGFTTDQYVKVGQDYPLLRVSPNTRP